MRPLGSKAHSRKYKRHIALLFVPFHSTINLSAADSPAFSPVDLEEDSMDQEPEILDWDCRGKR
jgi:hypothetical protein